MTLTSFEVGLLTTNENLPAFYVDAFGLERLTPIASRSAQVHRLGFPGGVLKIMIPASPPAEPDRRIDFLAVAGLRYLTLRFEQVEPVVERAVAAGATLQRDPIDLPSGETLFILTDPDGNTLEVAGRRG